MNDKPPPKTLYKFRSWNDCYHRLLLSEKKLWVPSADKLNDPFDCAIPLRFDLMKGGPIESFFKLLRKDSPEASDEDLKKHARLLVQTIEKLNLNQKEQSLERITRSMQKELGILSFTAIKESPLLWSHYSDSYKGYCIGFDHIRFRDLLEGEFTSKGFESSKIFYVHKMPSLIPSDDQLEEDQTFIRLAITKSHHWRHEEEYRYVFALRKNFFIEFPASVVSEIILGSEMPEGDRKVISLIAKNEFPSATLLQAQRKAFSYELEFLPVE